MVLTRPRLAIEASEHIDTGHTADITAVACSIVDSQPVALTTGADMTVRMWDLATATLRATFTGYEGWSRLALSAHGPGAAPRRVSGSPHGGRDLPMADGLVPASVGRQVTASQAGQDSVGKTARGLGAGLCRHRAAARGAG